MMNFTETESLKIAIAYATAKMDNSMSAKDFLSFIQEMLNEINKEPTISANSDLLAEDVQL